MSEAARYIQVPVPVWGQDDQTRTSPLGGAGRLHRKAPAPGGEGVGGGANPSCPVQEHNFHTPSDIAKDALIRFVELPPNDPRHRYDTLCEEFVKYLDRCEQKGFMVKGYDTKKGKIINLPMAYDNRWGKARRAELSDKLKRLEFWFEQQEDRPVTMITLTSYHEGVSIGEAWHELNKSRSKLLKLIAKYFDNPDYFWVPEPHKSGYVHYHLAVFADVSNNKKDNKGKGIEDKFRDLWSRKYKTGNHTYGLDFSQRKGDAKIQHLKNYLSKYLEKGFLLDKWTHGMLLFNAHLWDTGYRMYGASKNIRQIMNITDDHDFDGEVLYKWKEIGIPYIDKHTGKQYVEEPELAGYAELESYHVGGNIVWLETRLETIELTADNEEVEVSEVVWDRDYIPDFIDHSLWVGEAQGTILKNRMPFYRLPEKPRDKIFHCNWGRPYKGMRFFEQNVAKLPKAPLVSTQEQERRRLQKQTETEYSEVEPYDEKQARRARAMRDNEWSD